VFAVSVGSGVCVCVSGATPVFVVENRIVPQQACQSTSVSSPP